jgi:thioredoxin-like negative regulator of GroEL
VFKNFHSTLVPCERKTELEPSDFNGQTLRRSGVLAVMFIASWCPFCLRFRPAFETAAKVTDVPWACADISDDDYVLWDLFNIEIVPTVVLFKDGKPIFRKDGVRGQGLSQDDMREIIERAKSIGTAP